MKTGVPDIKEVLRAVKNSTIEVKLCPRCLERYFTPYGSTYVELVSPSFPALSRVDNVTYICNDCGTQEALEDAKMIKDWDEHQYWLDLK